MCHTSRREQASGTKLNTGCSAPPHWRGQPLISVETVIQLIGSTTTTTWLKIVCVKDDTVYKIGAKVNDEDFAAIILTNENIYH
jgi:hypothetical protein